MANKFRRVLADPAGRQSPQNDVLRKKYNGALILKCVLGNVFK